MTHLSRKKLLQGFVLEALAAAADIDRTEEVYRAEDVHDRLQRIARGEAPPPLVPWRGETED